MPCEFIALMVACTPLFSKPVFQHVQVLLIGAILTPSKFARRITGTDTGKGLGKRSSLRQSIHDRPQPAPLPRPPRLPDSTVPSGVGLFWSDGLAAYA